MVTIRRLEQWDGLVPEWVEPCGTTWLSRGPQILRAEGLNAAPAPVTRLDSQPWKNLLGRSRLARRLLRFAYYNVVPLADRRLFVSFEKSVRIFEHDRWIEVTGLTSQFRILRGCCAVAPSGDVFFGEYLPNTERNRPINIYRLPVGGVRAEIVWTFAPGEVRHVHSVRWDAGEGALWVCTGDLPHECKIITPEQATSGWVTEPVETAGKRLHKRLISGPASRRRAASWARLPSAARCGCTLRPMRFPMLSGLHRGI